MCTTLPPVLVTVLGIEKLLPSFADLEVFLQLLPRSSTGERMNPYTSLWTGVTPGDGPEELHVVLLDNGRTRVLARRGRPPGAALHPLQRLPERLPRLLAHRRARVRLGLSRPDRRDPDAAAAGHRARRRRCRTRRASAAPATRCARSRSTSRRCCCTCARRPSSATASRRERGGMRAAAWIFGSPRRLALAQRLGRLAQLPLRRGGTIRRLPPPLSGWTGRATCGRSRPRASATGGAPVSAAREAILGGADRPGARRRAEPVARAFRRAGRSTAAERVDSSASAPASTAPRCGGSPTSRAAVEEVCRDARLARLARPVGRAGRVASRRRRAGRRHAADARRARRGRRRAHGLHGGDRRDGHDRARLRPERRPPRRDARPGHAHLRRRASTRIVELVPEAVALLGAPGGSAARSRSSRARPRPPTSSSNRVEGVHGPRNLVVLVTAGPRGHEFVTTPPRHRNTAAGHRAVAYGGAFRSRIGGAGHTLWRPCGSALRDVSTTSGGWSGRSRPFTGGSVRGNVGPWQVCTTPRSSSPTSSARRGSTAICSASSRTGAPRSRRSGSAGRPSSAGSSRPTSCSRLRRDRPARRDALTSAVSEFSYPPRLRAAAGSGRSPRSSTT